MDTLSQRSATPVSNWLPTPSPAPQSQQLYAGQGHGQHQYHQHVQQYLQQQHGQHHDAYVGGSQNNLLQLNQPKQVTQPEGVQQLPVQPGGNNDEFDRVSMPPPPLPPPRPVRMPRSPSTTPSEGGESWCGIPLNNCEKLMLIQLCVANIQTYKLPNVSGCVRWWQEVADKLVAKKITRRPWYNGYSASNAVSTWITKRKATLAEEQTSEEVEDLPIDPEHGNSLNNFDQALDCWIAKVAEVEAEAAGRKESAEQLAERLAETERQRDNLRKSFSWKRKRAAITTGSSQSTSSSSGRIVDLTVTTDAEGPPEAASTSTSRSAAVTASSDADDTTTSGGGGQRRRLTRYEQQQAQLAQRAEQAEKRLRLSDDMVAMMRQQHETQLEFQREQMAMIRDMLTVVAQSVARPPPER